MTDPLRRDSRRSERLQLERQALHRTHAFPAWGIRGRALGGIGSCLTALIIVYGAAGSASAHATVVATSPAADRSVPRSPGVISLSFNEDITIDQTPVTLEDSAGNSEPLGEATLSQHSTLLTVPVTARLPGAIYTVTWQVTSADGDTVAGSYRFGVGPRLSGQLTGHGSGQRLSNPGRWPTALLRWLLFTAFAIGFGGIAAAVLTRRRPPAGRPPAPPPLVLPAAVGGMAAALGLAAINVGNGDVVQGFAHPSISQLLQGREGLLVGVELVAFALAGILAVVLSPISSAVPFLVVAATEGLRGHPDALAGDWGALLLTVHLCVVAVWVGGLVQVLRTAAVWRSDRRLVWLLIWDYSRWALWVFLVVVATGVTASLIVTPIGSIPSTTYGRVLLVKVALVVGAATIAYTARRQLLASPAVDRVVSRARIESVTLLGVLAVTGLLVSVPPPRVPGGPPLFPPPLYGPSVAVGGRAGQIGVLVQAAQGRVNVLLTAPGLGGITQQQSGQKQAYRLTGALQAAGGETRQDLEFTGCGTGCFTSAARLSPGLGQLSLDAQADGWTGGAIALTLPWPPRPAPRQLVDVVTEMRRLPKFTLYEQVTSDTSQGLGSRRRFSLDGASFLASEPYGQGKAAITDAYTAPAGTILDLAYPTDGITVQLTVDADNRIVRETLVSPNHLVVRSFVYPETRKAAGLHGQPGAAPGGGPRKCAMPLRSSVGYGCTSRDKDEREGWWHGSVSWRRPSWTSSGRQAARYGSARFWTGSTGTPHWPTQPYRP